LATWVHKGGIGARLQRLHPHREGGTQGRIRRDPRWHIPEGRVPGRSGRKAIALLLLAPRCLRGVRPQDRISSEPLSKGASSKEKLPQVVRADAGAWQRVPDRFGMDEA